LFSLSETLNKMIDMIRIQAEDKEIGLELDITNTVPDQIYCDEDRI
jgi:signal transduction histidine kinase